MSNEENKESTENKDTKEVNLSNNEAITIPQETFPEFKTNIELIKKEAYYRDREFEKAVKTGRGSIAIRKDGVVSASSNHISTIQLTPDGIAAQTSPYFGIKNNTHSVDSKDHIINGHKLNNKLYELSDFKKVLDGYDQTAKIAGGLTMLGTVLVRAWEPNLKRYVLVRRLINIPMFSPSLGSLEAPEGLGIKPNTNTIKELMNQINTTGISSYAQLATQLEQKRQEAIKKQEESTTEKVKKLIEENSKKQAISATTLTGQDPTQVGASQIVTGAMQNMTGLSSQHGGGGGSFTGDKSVRYEGTSNDMAKEAWSEAQRIAKDLNVDPTIIYGQWYHESGGFSSKLAMENCNLGGLTQTTPNGAENKQPDGGNYYMVFKSIHDYAEYFKRIWGPDIKGVSSAEQYASNLKREGYYGDSYENYVAGIYGGMKHIPSSTA